DAHGYDRRAVVERRHPQSDVGAEDAATRQVDDLDVQGARLAVWARSLDARERHLTEREARVDALAMVVGLAPEVPQATWLEAEPLRRHLDALTIDTGEEIAHIAEAHGLDPNWARHVVDGRVSRVELARVRQVCEGLRCTPYDLWGTAAARSVAHAYGPSEWPADVEPLVSVGPG
ncbi:MAG TPA: hypothetical protein VF711_09775, partial [Acidimicrobiales bacterium]